MFDRKGYMKNYRKINSEKIANDRNIWLENNKEKVKKAQQDRVKKLKLEVLGHYSNGQPKCSCCGEIILDFLTIDHINNGGCEHRKKIKAFGTNFYWWLKKNNFPEGYQTLCSNCNTGRKCNNGICPHKRVINA